MNPGFTPITRRHALKSIGTGKAISTRRDRYDRNGIDHEGFHPFFTKEGKLRGELEFLTDKPRHRPPWQKV